jgi:long-chain acyl-CoA synthetase
VGRPIPGVEVRIADDGEILVRGPGVMQGYYKRPEETARAVDTEGWFHTGDVGHLDHDGFLALTDRKKAIIVTTTGHKVAPAAIENALVADEFISQAVVYGNGRRFISALIVLDQARVERFAAEQDIALGDPEELLNHAEVSSLMQRRIDAAMARFAPHERVRRFKLLHRPFSQERGDLTPTLKLKRGKIIDQYQRELDALYND